MKETYKVVESKFGNMECVELKKDRKVEKKYNIKFNLKDLKLIEQLAQQFECSQSQVINAVLRNWLLKEFREVVGKAPDCGAAVALVADCFAGLTSSVDVASCCSDPSIQDAIAYCGNSGIGDIISMVDTGPYFPSNFNQHGYKANYTEYFDVYLKYLIDFMNKHELKNTELYLMLTDVLNKIESDDRSKE